MKENIKNVIAIGIALSVMNSSIVPVFAAESTESLNASKQTQSYNNNEENISISQGLQDTGNKKNLKLDDAIEAAINNSDKLTLKSKQIKMYEDKMDLQEKTNDFYESIGQKIYDYPYDKLELQEKQTEQSKDFMEDQIASDITNKYNDMILKEIDIEKSKRNLKLKNNDLNYLNGKLSLGMATPNQITDVQIEIKSLQDEITAKEDSLNNSKDYFKVLTDLDIKNTYKLDWDMNYIKFTIDGSVNEYIDDKIDKYLKYETEILKLTKDYMKDLKDDGIKNVMDEEITAPDKSKFVTNDATGNSAFDSTSYALSLIDYQQKEQNKLNACEQYFNGKYNMEESQVKLDDSKKNLKNGLKESYSTLLDLENKIDRLKEQVISTNTKLRFAKAQVDMGLMLKNDYDEQVLASEDLDTTLRKIVYTHNNLRDSIEKPWILNNQ